VKNPHFCPSGQLVPYDSQTSLQKLLLTVGYESATLRVTVQLNIQFYCDVKNSHCHIVSLLVPLQHIAVMSSHVGLVLSLLGTLQCLMNYFRSLRSCRLFVVIMQPVTYLVGRDILAMLSKRGRQVIRGLIMATHAT
jgi:hypothetical protein